MKIMTIVTVIAGFALGYVVQTAHASAKRGASNAISSNSRSLRGDQTSIGASGSSTTRFPRNATEFDQMFQEIKNWGRWGPDDQLGAANLITEAKRKQAIALARIGRVVSLAHPLLTEAAGENGSPFEHTMHARNPHRHSEVEECSLA